MQTNLNKNGCDFLNSTRKTLFLQQKIILGVSYYYYNCVLNRTILKHIVLKKIKKANKII